MSPRILSDKRKQKFIQAWKKACNSPRRKSTLETHDEWFERNPKEDPKIQDPKYAYAEVERSKNGWWWTTKGTGQHRVAGWLQAEHYLLYNIIMGKDWDSGFECTTNPKRIRNHGTPCEGLREACWILRSHIRKIERFNEENNKIKCDSWLKHIHQFVHGKNKTKDDYYKRLKEPLKYVDKFLEPFNGTIVYDDLIRIEMWHPGKLEVMEKFLNKFKPRKIYY
jgi:hypothetical protein